MGKNSQHQVQTTVFENHGYIHDSLDGHRMDSIGNHESTVDSKTVKLSIRDYCLVATFAWVNIIIGAAYSVLAPFFPKEAEDKGLSPMIYGLLYSVQEIVIFILCPIFGVLLPKLGFRRTLLVSAIISSSGIGVFGALDLLKDAVRFTIFCAVIRAFGSIGLAGLSSASYAAIPVYYPHHISQIFGLLEMCYGLGMIVGPLLGGLLYEFGGFGLPFYVCGVLMFLTFPSMFILFPRVERISKHQKSASISKILGHFRIFLNLFVTLILCVTTGFNQSTLEPHIRDFSNLSSSQVGLIILLNGLFYGIATWVVGILLGKVKDGTFMSVIGLIITILAFITVGPMYPINLILAPSIVLVITSQILLGIGTSLCLVSNFTQAMREKDLSDLKADVGSGSIISSLFVTVYALGTGIGPTIGGYLIEQFAFAKSCLVMSIICAVTGCLVILTMICHKRPVVGDVITPKVPVQRLGSAQF